MGLKERRARERQERKRQILDAARTLLFSEGLQGTSINKIAEKAELAIGTIYFYFRNKEDIFAALQQEGISILHSRIQEAVKQDENPETKLRATARVYLDFSRENKDYFDIINYFLSSPKLLFSPSVKEQIDENGNRVIQALVETIEQGISSGIFRKVDAWRFAMLFWAALHGLIQFRKLRSTMLKTKDYQGLIDYSVDYLIHSLKNDAPGQDHHAKSGTLRKDAAENPPKTIQHTKFSKEGIPG